MGLLVVVLRLAQISVALLAFIVLIGATINYNYTYHDQDDFRPPNGFLVMAGFWCLFNIMALGVIGLLALFRPQDLARYLMFIFDLLALCASIAGGIVIARNARHHQKWYVAYRVIVMLQYLCTAIIVAVIIRSIYQWGLHKYWRPIDFSFLSDTKVKVDKYTPEEIQRLEKRVEQLETEARYRSFTPSETIARWTSYSAEQTLSDYESEKYD